MSNGMPPFRPNDIASDAQWLPLCSPQDRLTYSTAKGAYDQAIATAAQVVAAAKLACSQAIARATATFENSRTAALAAGQVLDAKVAAANARKNAISGTTADLRTRDVRADPSSIRGQADGVSAALATYTTASNALIASQASYRAAITALAKVSDSVDPRDPGNARMSSDAADIANANREIATAGATAARDKAENVFNAVRIQLWTRLDDQNDEPPDPKAPTARRERVSGRSAHRPAERGRKRTDTGRPAC